MDRSQQQRGGDFEGVDLSLQDFSDGAVIRGVCEIAPLSPEEQLTHLIAIRRATVVVRSEVARFPEVLELLLRREFTAGDFPDREAMVSALQETRAMWARRGEDDWLRAYEQRLDRNVALVLGAFDALFDLSERPYADAIEIENHIREICRGASSVRSDGAESGGAEARTRYEELALRPFEAIITAADLIRATDEAIGPSRKLMVESNVRLVARAVSNYKSQGNRSGLDAPGALDFFQEGILGLMAAMDRFRPELGYRFSTYALHWIKQAIGRCQHEEDLIAVPHQTKALLARERRIRQQLTSESGYVPHEDEVRERMKLSPSEARTVDRAKKIVFEPPLRSLFGERIDILDTVPANPWGDRRLSEAREAQKRVARAMERLFEGKSFAVMVRRFTTGFGARLVDRQPTLADLGEELGLTRQRVSQIERIGVGVLTDFFIVESHKPSVRAEVLGRVCSADDRRIIENIMADRYEPIASKGAQAGLLRLCATALMLAEIGANEWPRFAEAARLSPLQAFIVRDRVIEGNDSFSLASMRAVAAGLAPPSFLYEDAEKLFALSMRILAPVAREEFKRRRAAD